MNIIAVDDEFHALSEIEHAVLAIAENASMACFMEAAEALDYARTTRVDVAFLDIEMNEMNGLFLAKHLKDIYGGTNIIFVTGYNQYVLNAFALHASGYVLKPINPERVKNELENLRHPVPNPDTGIYVQCFGSFELFVDGTPVIFNRPKSKEALAYLVDRKGARVSKKELAAVLWEDKPYTRSIQSHLHILLEEISTSLVNSGAENFIMKEHGYYSVDTSKFICDYYNYEKGDAFAVNCYRGEYMTNYSWGEFKIGMLDKLI